MNARKSKDEVKSKNVYLGRSTPSRLAVTIGNVQVLDQSLIDTLQSILDSEVHIRTQLLPPSCEPLSEVDRERVWALRALQWLCGEGRRDMQWSHEQAMYGHAHEILRGSTVFDRQRLARWVNDPPVTGIYGTGTYGETVNR